MLARQPEALPPDLVDACITEFFDKMFTTVPILHRGWVQQRASEITTSPEAYCVIGALCVYMVALLRVEMPAPSNPLSMASTRSQTNSLGLRLVEDIKRMRNQTDYSDNPTTGTILTSFFLSAGLFNLERQNTGWFYLQEAITFVKMMRIHREESYSTGGPQDVMNRRLFWILFISERAQALHKHRDILLHETIDFPQPDPDDPVDELGIKGLTCLYNMFGAVDDRFSETWTSLRSATRVAWPQNTATWLAGLQQQLTEAVPLDLKCTKIQEADLRVTQQWLRLVVWQLSTASGCLSSAAHDESMTLLYPIKLSKELAETLQYIEVSAMDVEKLFDIAYSLADIIALNAVETGTYEAGPGDHLTAFLSFVSTLRNGETKFVGLLQAKIREVLPSLAISLGLLHPPPPPPTPSSTRSASSSGNAHQPLIPPLGRLDGTESSVSSPYGSPSAMTSAPPHTSVPMRFAVGRQVASPASPDAGDAATTMSMGVSRSIGSPAGSTSE
ncbi:MAG: hypothetical protein LQ340_006334, partial [Diploschistes diacapsis]